MAPICRIDRHAGLSDYPTLPAQIGDSQRNGPMTCLNQNDAKTVRFADVAALNAAGIRILGRTRQLTRARPVGFVADIAAKRIFEPLVLKMATKKGCPRYAAGYRDNDAVVVRVDCLFSDDAKTSRLPLTVSQVRQRELADFRAAVEAEQLAEAAAAEAYKAEDLRSRWDAFQSRRQSAPRAA